MDDKDRVVGTTTLGECLERGLIHRAVDVIVRRSDGRILMQRRNKKDLWLRVSGPFPALAMSRRVNPTQSWHDGTRVGIDLHN